MYILFNINKAFNRCSFVCYQIPAHFQVLENLQFLDFYCCTLFMNHLLWADHLLRLLS